MAFEKSDALDNVGREDFTCAMCGEFFAKSRSDEEAAAEYSRDFPDHDVTDALVICGDCYKVLTLDS